MYVARKNSTFKLKDVTRLFLEARETITRESWEKAERHVIEKAENKFWETDGVQEEIAPFIITVDDESEDDDDDNLEVCFIS